MFDKKKSSANGYFYFDGKLISSHQVGDCSWYIFLNQSISKPDKSLTKKESLNKTSIIVFI